MSAPSQSLCYAHLQRLSDGHRIRHRPASTVTRRDIRAETVPSPARVAEVEA